MRIKVFWEMMNQISPVRKIALFGIGFMLGMFVFLIIN